MSLESPAAGGAQPFPQRRRLLDDPLTIRALAHPLRLELLSIVGRAGKLTTAGAARELGVSHGLTSHHLWQLAKYGFVEQVDGKDNRERPWRLTSTSHSWESADTTPETEVATDVLEAVQAEQGLSHLLGWLERRKGWPSSWRRSTGVGQSNIYLTLPELAELADAIDSLILRYVDERPIDDLSSRPEGSVPIEITLFVVPLGKSAEED